MRPEPVGCQPVMPCIWVTPSNYNGEDSAVVSGELKRLVRQAKLLSHVGLSKLPAFAADKFRRYFWAKVEHRLVLFQLDRAVLAKVGMVVTDVASYQTLDDVPADCFTDAVPAAGKSGHSLRADAVQGLMPRGWFAGRFAEGAHLWLLRDDGHAAAALWTIEGNSLDTWYVPLRPHDIVVYAVVTHPIRRGRGLASRLACAAARAELTPDNDLFLDCRRWNLAAQRAFQRVGFKPFATVSPK
jgi:GNAT superfamily N-acetyltransferase